MKGRSGKHLKLQTKWRGSLLRYNKNLTREFGGGRARARHKAEQDEKRMKHEAETGAILLVHNANSGQVGQREETESNDSRSI